MRVKKPKVHCLTVQADGTVILPAEMLERAGLKPGAIVSAAALGDGVFVAVEEGRDPEQWWFWTDEWQAGEREADEDIAAGRVTTSLTEEEFDAALRARLNNPVA